MSDRYIEKTFIYLVVLSVLLHLAVFELVALIPPEKEKATTEPTMVDLTDLPEPPPELPPRPNLQRSKPPEVKRLADRRQRVARETAPKGEHEPRTSVPPVSRVAPPPRPAEHPARVQGPVGRTSEPIRPPEKEGEVVTRGEGIFKPKTGEATDRSKLFPSAGRLARLEESYREKYSREVEDGEAKFLNTDDIQFGSFLRRLETAVYGVWHYPQAALLRGIEGTTPVRVTFNRSGEIVHIDLLESSGSAILDDEVMRTLKALGPIGSFPRGYPGQTFKLIAFFHYGNGGGRLR